VSPLDRRRFLRVATTAACAACLPVAACQPQPDAQDGPLRISLDELPPGERVRRRVGNTPVELLRTGDEVLARSLLCTHQGCEVVWSETDREYICPCHEGRFDAAGQPVYGLPRRALRTLTVTRREGDVVVDG
jgi:Rieske Fe-S protein